MCERRVCDDRQLLRRHGRTDFLRASEVAAAEIGDDRAELLEYMRDIGREVHALLADADVWRAVTALAEVLQRVQSLDGERAVGILEAVFSVRRSA